MDLMITGDDCTNKHKNLRSSVNLAMTQVGALEKGVRGMGTYLCSFQQMIIKEYPTSFTLNIILNC